MRSSTTRTIAHFGTVLLGVSAVAFARPTAPADSVRAPQVTEHALFGWRVDIHDEWAVIAAPFESVSGDVAAGRVYLHSAMQGWQQTQVLETPSPQAARTFGWSVALSDGLLAVGAPGDHDGELMSGAVYLYERHTDGWALSFKVLNPEPVIGSRFGGAVDISSNVLVVAAHRAFGSAERSGAVYMFERDSTSWQFVKELYPSTLIPDEAFGTTVRLLDDSTVAVGRSMADVVEGRIEAVTIFSRRGGIWSQQDLAGPPGNASDLFGASLSVNDRYLAVGAPGAVVNGFRCGSVFLFDRSTMTLLWTVNNPRSSELVAFGGSVALTDDRVYIGAVQAASKQRVPTGMVVSYALAAFDSASAEWYALEDREGNPHSCPQVSATDSILLASTPFCDVDGTVDAGMARFFSVSGTVNAEDPVVPFEYSLAQNFPNPFNPVTHINFSLKAPGRVRLELFNILGQRVATLLDAEMTAGKHSSTFQAPHLASGVYFYRIVVNDFTALKKMMVLK